MPIRQLWFTPQMHTALLREVERAGALEACGVLAGVVSGEQGQVMQVIPLPNIADDPTRSYRMDDALLGRTADVLHNNGHEIIAFYHSHPNSTPIPSRADVLLATNPHIPIVIVGQRNGALVSAAWAIAYGEVEPIDSRIADLRPAAPTRFSLSARILTLAVLVISALVVLVTALSLLPPAPEIPR